MTSDGNVWRPQPWKALVIFLIGWNWQAVLGVVIALTDPTLRLDLDAVSTLASEAVGVLLMTWLFVVGATYVSRRYGIMQYDGVHKTVLAASVVAAFGNVSQFGLAPWLLLVFLTVIGVARWLLPSPEAEEPVEQGT